MTEGTGTFSLMTAADGNDGSERTAELRLVSTDGNTTYAVCSVSQKAAASQEPSITFSMNSATVKATLTVLTNPMSYQNLTGLNATVSGGLSAAAASIESSSVKVTLRAEHHGLRARRDSHGNRNQNGRQGNIFEVVHDCAVGGKGRHMVPPGDASI